MLYIYAILEDTSLLAYTRIYRYHNHCAPTNVSNEIRTCSLLEHVNVYTMNLCAVIVQDSKFFFTCITIDRHIIYSLAGNVKSSNSG